ncbi:MAG: glycosyltransferase family 4 protein, partial [Planctomycetota bacterium]|nr:glycosyltransferase family 4 protein [Planctomycetota bacterium]
SMLGRRRPVKVATRRMDYPLRRGAVSRWLYGRAVDSVVVISDAIGAAIRRAGVPEQSIIRIYEGVDSEELEGVAGCRAEVLARFDWPTDAVVILCAASLRPRKGQIHLLRAFAGIANGHPRARLLLAGEGDERNALQAEIVRLGLGDQVLMPGQMPRREVLGVADIACIPSQLEGLSVFSLESMAVGLPVIASRVGGLPEGVVDGETGVLVEPGDVAGFAAALDLLLSDPELSRKMGEAGGARARASFSARMMAEKTERLYEELIASVK